MAKESSESHIALQSGADYEPTVGDIVVVLINDYGDEGYIGPVESIDRDGDIWVNSNCYGLDDLSLYKAKTSNYVPAVGDVVEFEWEGQKVIGVIAPDTDIAGYAEEDIEEHDAGGYLFSEAENLKPTGENIGTPDSWSDTCQKSYEIAKSYFSAQPAKFKVGDKVYSDGNSTTVYYVRRILPEDQIEVEPDPSSGHLYVSDANGFHLLKPTTFQPDPDKSYAENQAAWVEFHGIEVGSKVKVVKGYRNGDNGFSSSADDSSFPPKAKCIGSEYEISVITDERLRIRAYNGSDYTFPYFCLEPTA